MSDADARWDIVLVPENRDLRVPMGSAKSLLIYLATTRVVKPVDEAIAKDWVEVYCQPEVMGHEPFVTTTYEGPPPFLEAVIRFGNSAEPPPFGTSDPVTFWLEFRGARWPEPLGPLRKRIKEMIFTRAEVFSRPHEGLPPHRVVPPDEVPGEELKKRVRDVSTGVAGTRVEEY